MPNEILQIRTHGDAALPALIYLPGIHGDWTLVSSFRERMKSHVRFVEVTYPRTLDWSLDDYAAAILEQLAANDIREGILLGESFGSQVAWAMFARCADPNSVAADVSPLIISSKKVRADSRRLQQPTTEATPGDRSVAPPFRASTLILAGGFVRYPFMPLVDFTRAIWAVMPAWLVRAFFKGYAIFARWRHRHAPETAAAIKEFVARRTMEDLAAMGHRLKLIRESDPCEIVGRIGIPVYQLAGFWDPIVWRPSVKRWLHANCPGYCATQVIPFADHNVLGTAPDVAAEIVTGWITQVRTR